MPTFRTTLLKGGVNIVGIEIPDAVLLSFGAGKRVGPDDVAGQLDVTAELLPQRFCDRSERERGIRPPLRPAEVRGDDDLGTGVGQRLQRRH